MQKLVLAYMKDIILTKPVLKNVVMLHKSSTFQITKIAVLGLHSQGKGIR